MSLDVGKLEKVRELAGGIVQAQCPACAEGGGDRKGEHLRIYPDGRYGCCVHPKDGEHRKRIFALAGSLRTATGKPGTFTVRLKVLAHGHQTALPAARSVKAALTEWRVQSAECRMKEPEGAGTPGTPKTESENGVPSVPRPLQTATTPAAAGFGTPGTGNSELRAYAREDSTAASTYTGGDSLGKLKDLESGVPSVPRSLQTATDVGAEPPPATAPSGEPPMRLPYLTPGGTLVIPFDSPERYRWWKPPHEERQRVATTLNEVRAGLANKRG